MPVDSAPKRLATDLLFTFLFDAYFFCMLVCETVDSNFILMLVLISQKIYVKKYFFYFDKYIQFGHGYMCFLNLTV